MHLKVSHLLNIKRHSLPACERRQEARVLPAQSILPRGPLIPLKFIVNSIQIKPREQQGPPVSSSLAFSVRL